MNGEQGKDKFILKDSGDRQSFESGAVRDIQVGKGRFDLISPFALLRIARVYEKGALKYAARNWEKGMPYGRFIDSALRHITQYMICLLYTSPSPRDATLSRMPSSA